MLCIPLTGCSVFSVISTMFLISISCTPKFLLSMWHKVRYFVWKELRKTLLRMASEEKPVGHPVLLLVTCLDLEVLKFDRGYLLVDNLPFAIFQHITGVYHAARSSLLTGIPQFPTQMSGSIREIALQERFSRTTSPTFSMEYQKSVPTGTRSLVLRLRVGGTRATVAPRDHTYFHRNQNVKWMTNI